MAEKGYDNVFLLSGGIENFNEEKSYNNISKNITFKKFIYKTSDGKNQSSLTGFHFWLQLEKYLNRVLN